MRDWIDWFLMLLLYIAIGIVAVLVVGVLFAITPALNLADYLKGVWNGYKSRSSTKRTSKQSWLLSGLVAEGAIRKDKAARRGKRKRANL